MKASQLYLFQEITSKSLCIHGSGESDLFLTVHKRSAEISVCMISSQEQSKCTKPKNKAQVKEGNGREGATAHLTQVTQICRCRSREMSSCKVIIKGPLTRKMIQEFFVPVAKKHMRSLPCKIVLPSQWFAESAGVWGYF